MVASENTPFESPVGIPPQDFQVQTHRVDAADVRPVLILSGEYEPWFHQKIASAHAN